MADPIPAAPDVWLRLDQLEAYPAEGRPA